MIGKSVKRDGIMRAAEQLCRTRQPREITLDEIAARADIGKGTIYLYFSSKDDLLFQTAVSGFDEMCADLERLPKQKMPLRGTLLRACECISAFSRKRRPLFRMILSEGERAMGQGGNLRERWMKRRTKMVGAVARLFERGIANGEIRSDAPPEVMAEYLLGMLRVRSAELERVPEAAKKLESMVDLFAHGAAFDKSRPPAAVEHRRSGAAAARRRAKG